jgi:hypothetical protein
MHVTLPGDIALGLDAKLVLLRGIYIQEANDPAVYLDRVGIDHGGPAT